MNSCDHLNQIREVTTAGAGCEECGRSGDSWVHLRVCLTCGHVGCCDESKNRHAHRHYHETGHPIIRSFERGEDWMWCYVDSTVLYPSPETGGVHVATSKEFLRSLTLFVGLDEEDLDHLTSMAEPVSVKAGEVLIVEGSPGDSMYVVLDGELEVIKQGAQGPVLLSVRRKGEVIGEQSLLEHGPRSATVRAITECRLLKISEAAFGQVLASSPSAVTAVLRTVTSRLRSTQSLLMQQEKMASLGNLAAGLAHELNNPAAAVRRSADHLTDVMSEWQRLAVELDTLTFSPEQATRMRDLREEMSRRCSDEVVLAPLERSDREGELEVWLDEHGVEEAWDRAPVLVSFGWSVDDLEQLAEDFPAEHLPIVVPWLAVGCSAYGLLDEVKTGAGRISDIVKAVKTYSYLDQAPIQDADLHEGLENTLVILKHKLKAGVTVHREYAPDLPHIEAFASELNQVWTNLIDNAIDAMQGQGDLTLRTYDHRELGEVVVEIEDTGPGIPEDVQPHIFELFFTTKGPGAGTGLGLHIVHNIIVNKHRGRLDFTSRPGQTVFRITLPVKLARREG